MRRLFALRGLKILILSLILLLTLAYTGLVSTSYVVLENPYWVEH